MRRTQEKEIQNTKALPELDFLQSTDLVDSCLTPMQGERDLDLAYAFPAEHNLDERTCPEPMGQLANSQSVFQEFNYFDPSTIELVYPGDSDEECLSGMELGDHSTLNCTGHIYPNGYENSQLEDGESMLPEHCSADLDGADSENPNDMAEDNHSFGGPTNLKRRRVQIESDQNSNTGAIVQNITVALAPTGSLPHQSRPIQPTAQNSQSNNSDQHRIEEQKSPYQSNFGVEQIQSRDDFRNCGNIPNYLKVYQQYKNSISELHPNFIIKSIPELISEFNQRCQKLCSLAQSHYHMNQNNSNLAQALEQQFAYDLGKYTAHLSELRNRSVDIPNYQRNLFDFEEGDSISSITSGSQFSQLQLSSVVSQSDGPNGQAHVQFFESQNVVIGDQTLGAQSEHVINYSQGHLERMGYSSSSNKSEQQKKQSESYNAAQQSGYPTLNDANNELMYDIQHPALFIFFIQMKTKLAQIEFEYMTQFQAFAIGYSTNFPTCSNSIRLYRQYKISEQEIKRIVDTEFRIPSIMVVNESPMMLKENHGLIDTDTFFNLCPGQDGLHYVPKSKYKVLNQELQQVWQEFLQHIQNFRVNAQEFNAMYVNAKHHFKRLSYKKEELYSNLFYAISVTQIQLENSLRKYMDVHRLELMEKQKQRFSKDFISYMISLKHQHYQIIDSTQEMVEQFAFQHFELFDQTDYRRFIKQNLDMISRNFEMSQSPYRMLRERSKRSVLHKLSFVKYIWKEVQLKKREIILRKGTIEIIDQASTPNSHKQSRQRPFKAIKQRDVQDFYQEVLQLRWDYSAVREDIIFKVSKQPKREQKKTSKLSKIKQKRMKTQRLCQPKSSTVDENQEEMMDVDECQALSDDNMTLSIESAFDALFQANPRSQRYVKSPILHNIDNLHHSAQSPPSPQSHPASDQDSDLQDLMHKYHDFLPQIPDVLIEDFIYASNKNGQIRQNQAIFKTIQDLPHLSVLEKNACFFISA